VALRPAVKAVRILYVVQRAAGRVNNSIGPTTGWPPRREYYTKAQGRRVERQQRRKALDGLLYNGMPAASCRRTRVRGRQSQTCRGHCCEHRRWRCCLARAAVRCQMIPCLGSAVVRPVAERIVREGIGGMIGCRCLWSWSGVHTEERQIQGRYKAEGGRPDEYAQ
jgi:hypothetical protein